MGDPIDLEDDTEERVTVEIDLASLRDDDSSDVMRIPTSDKKTSEH